MRLTSTLSQFLRVAAIFVAASGFAAPAHAGEPTQDIDIRPTGEQVTGESLSAAFSGVTHKGSYAILRENTGTKDYTETTFSDGTVTYNEGDMVATGQWRRFGERICYSYEQDHMAGGCFYVYQVGNCYYYYGSNAAGIMGAQDGLYWIARSVKTGETASCDPVIG
ncbi:hypothetical protein [Robiginitomaculum antarcticum]|uniref:hypothetical protein n=1 Tax=Robiginitomaculum antarcticum TaxID=437507 RepID=UPI000376F7C0|nr:hypothetical protein [Robiginitomaculum antarcticum]